MVRRKRWIAAAAVAVAVAGGGAGLAVAGGAGGDDDDGDGGGGGGEVGITGDALDQASAAALAHTRGGRVTETEVGDEESYYEVEVTLADGSQVDVQLDEGFTVVGSEADHDGPDDDDDDSSERDS